MVWNMFWSEVVLKKNLEDFEKEKFRNKVFKKITDHKFEKSPEWNFEVNFQSTVLEFSEQNFWNSRTRF